MQFTTITVACLSALAASVSAQNAAADAMTQATTAATTGASTADAALTTTSTTTSTTTRTVSYAHTITRSSVASAIMPTGGYIGSNSTASAISTPAQPSASDAAAPASYDSGAGAYVVSQALVAALGLGAVAVVAL